MRFLIACGLAALAGGRCLADGRLLGRRLFLGCGGGGGRGLVGGLGLSLYLDLGLLFGGSGLSLCLVSCSFGRGLLGRGRCALAQGGLGGRLGLDGCLRLGLGGRLLDFGGWLCGCLGRGGLRGRRLRCRGLLGCRCLLGGRGRLFDSGLCRSLGGRLGLSGPSLYLGSSLDFYGLLGSGGRWRARA